MRNQTLSTCQAWELGTDFAQRWHWCCQYVFFVFFDMFNIFYVRLVLFTFNLEHLIVFLYKRNFMIFRLRATSILSLGLP